MADHRYWRIEIYNLVSGSYYLYGGALAEVEMRSSKGGSDLTGSGTPSASSEYSATYVASKAFDNDGDTLWCATDSVYPAWLKYDFGEGNAYDIEELVVTIRGDDYWSGMEPYHLALSYSDDNLTWTMKYLWSFLSWTQGEAKTLNDTNDTDHYGDTGYRYWRLAYHANGGVDFSMAFSIANEIEFRESVDGSDETGSGTPSAFYSNASYPIANAFDNDYDSTLWSSYEEPNKHHTERWIAYDFGSGVTKNIVEWLWKCGELIPNGSPNSYIMFCSNDGSTWKYAWAEFLAANSWSSSESKVFTNPDYISGWSHKIYGLDPATIAKINGDAIANIAKVYVG